MHAADAARSPRLRRVLDVLSDGRWHTTRDLVREADVVAVNSCVAELRQGGLVVACERVPGQRAWRYRLERQPDLFPESAA